MGKSGKGTKIVIKDLEVGFEMKGMNSKQEEAY